MTVLQSTTATTEAPLKSIVTTPESPALRPYLAGTLRKLRHGYRRRIKRCQRKLSEKAVHALRIDTRRLMALLDLLKSLHLETPVNKTRKMLKRRLDSFDRLRDQQICLALLKPMQDQFPEARDILRAWQESEGRLAKRQHRDLKAIKPERMHKRLKSLERKLGKSADRGQPALNPDSVSPALRQAFGEVVRWRHRIRPRDATTIHRTRVAFKQFRYLCELLRPFLPGLTEAQLKRMRSCQGMMGDVQDMEVLLNALLVWNERNAPAASASQRLLTALSRKRRELIRHFLARADDLLALEPARLQAALNAT